MSGIPLTGLRGDHPLGFLAAVGLLRACGEADALCGARLAWREANGWHAVLHLPGAEKVDDLVACLAARAAGRAAAAELTWADSPRVPVADFRTAAETAEAEWAAGRPGLSAYLPALACDVVPDGSEVRTGAFYMTSGQQQFLREARKAVEAAGRGLPGKPPAEVFRETLLGPWRYEDPVHPLGWDPAAERLHALRGRSPTKEGSVSVAGAVALAVDALPLFPVLVAGGRPVTAGFSRPVGGKVTCLTWPLWPAPVGLGGVRSLLTLPELAVDRPAAAELRARGVAAVFRSERYKLPTQGAYYILRPAGRLP